jgi:dUTP pyrophosphatase
MKVQLLSKSAKAPARSTLGSAGLDLFASKETVLPGSTVRGKRVNIGHMLVSTGIAVDIPAGYVGRIGSRSGLSAKNNIEVGAGWIDPDYRGEVFVELKNLNSLPFRIAKGDKIAQLFLIKISNEKVMLVRSLPASKRGKGGFGSTGMR